MIKMNDVQLSREQENCISYKSGDLVVNGVPGSGKSVVLMHRAVDLYKTSVGAHDRQVVWLTTYGNILTKYIQDTFKQGNFDENSFKIETMDKYCSKIYYKEFGWINYLDDNERPEYVTRALQNHYQNNKKNSKFYSVDAKFWEEEFLWIKQKHLMSVEEYIAAERTGRGGSVRIRREERRFVYELFEEYCTLLRRDNKMDREDVYIALLDTKKNLSKYKYDYVLVDEGQDLSYVKLKVARMLCRKDITIAADRAQKIYKTGFTWKELGIDVSKNGSKRLHKSFRSTKQIVQLAESLAEVNRLKAADKGEYTEPVYPTRIGSDYPFIVECANKSDEKAFFINFIKGILKQEGTIGVLYRDYEGKEEIEGFLRDGNILFQEIKRNSEWSLETPGVKLVTLHSSKGLEFDTVIIPLFNSSTFPSSRELDKAEKEQVEEIKAQERNLLYVGMTRARYDLFMMYSGVPSEFLAEFNHDYYHYVSSKGTEIEKPKRVFDVDAIISNELNNIEVVKAGDTIRVHKEESNDIKIMYGSKIPNPQKWPFIGIHIGEKVRINNTYYVVDSICKNDDSDVEVLPTRKKEISWEDIKSSVDKRFIPYIDKLNSLGIPIATTISPELIGADGSVIAEGEMSWEKYQVVFLNPQQEKNMDIWENEGWKVLTLDTNLDSKMFFL